jgi:phage tail sheath gpL-like
MPISFSNIPANWKLPLYWIEVDPSQAGFPTIRQAALLEGYMLATGTAPADIPVAVGSLAEARQLFGAGSQLDAMFEKFFLRNFAAEVWAMPITPPGSGVAATTTMTVSTAPTAAGTIYPYVNGRRVAVGIAADDTTNEVALSIAAAISADPSMNVIAAVASGADVVTLTCKWKGIDGNGIDVRVNNGGTLAGETMPAGLGITVANAGKMTGGTGVPDLSAAIANLGDEPFEYVALAHNDSTTLTTFETEYGFSDSGRWGWLRQLYGHVITAYKGLYGAILSYGPNNNSPVVSILGVEAYSPTPVWEWAASYAANAARALLNDPARPLQTLPLSGCMPAPKHHRFTAAERNALATVGIAVQAVNGDGVPSIQREVTTYQRNLYGQGDDAYELVTTLGTLAKLFRNQRQRITSKYPRHKLANDGTRFGPGQAIVTPKTVKAELVAQYREDEFNGLVEDGTNFKKNLIVERDSNNPNRLNVLYPPDLINQLRIFAVVAQFRLQFDRGFDPATA